MSKIDVIWKSYHKPEIIDRGYWDNGLLEDIFKQFDVVHHTDFDWVQQGEIKEDQDGAVVIINGRTHTQDAAAINEDIAKLRWVLFIDTGDEEAVFPWREIKHPIMRVWVMMPRMNQHDDVSFHLPNGYRNETHEWLKDIGFKSKPVDWFFSGQVNHARREQCVYELQTFLDNNDQTSNGVLFTGDTFGKEIMPYRDYLTQMAETKIALCPSGIESPDNFRLYEALEAGCLPVVDAFSTNNQTPGFWQYLFAGDVPFPIVSYWDKLPDLMPELLKGYPENANKCYAWWQLKKREIKYKMLDDIKELSK